MIRASRLTLLLALVVWAPGARAQAPTDEAARLRASGDALFDRGHFAEAYESYARAYQLQHDAALLYNEARALEAMGEYPQALDKLDEFARIAPPEVRALVPKLARLTADLRGRITTLRVTTNAPGARLFVRDKDLGAIDRQLSVRVRSGTARVRLVADGFEPFEQELSLVGGSEAPVNAQLRPTRRASSGEGARTEQKPITSSWIFWTVVGAVVVVSATASVYALTTERAPEAGSFSPGQVRVQSFAW